MLAKLYNYDKDLLIVAGVVGFIITNRIVNAIEDTL